jgi:thiamine biosynthesis lipoprotein
MQRRAFLDPRPLLDDSQSFRFPASLTLLRVSRRAMATTFEIALPYGTPDGIAAAESALDLIGDIETWMTVFDDDSEVCRVNREATKRPIEVSEPLFDLLTQCAALSAETNGTFDPATGAMTKCWGFYRREGRLPTARERAEAMAASGMKHVVLDEVNRTVRFLRPGLELNFGSIGKGFALDRAAELLVRDWGIRSGLLQGGGSSIRAIGLPPEDSRGWSIGLKHPHHESHSLGTVHLTNNGLGTSAATYQYFVYKGKKYGHVLDPRTGHPAEGTASASVLAATAAEADAFSTAAFVMGESAFLEFARHRPEIDCVVLPADLPARTSSVTAI